MATEPKRTIPKVLRFEHETDQGRDCPQSIQRTRHTLKGAVAIFRDGQPVAKRGGFDEKGVRITLSVLSTFPYIQISDAGLSIILDPDQYDVSVNKPTVTQFNTIELYRGPRGVFGKTSHNMLVIHVQIKNQEVHLYSEDGETDDTSSMFRYLRGKVTAGIWVYLPLSVGESKSEKRTEAGDQALALYWSRLIEARTNVPKGCLPRNDWFFSWNELYVGENCKQAQDQDEWWKWYSLIWKSRWGDLEIPTWLSAERKTHMIMAEKFATLPLSAHAYSKLTSIAMINERKTLVKQFKWLSDGEFRAQFVRENPGKNRFQIRVKVTFGDLESQTPRLPGDGDPIEATIVGGSQDGIVFSGLTKRIFEDVYSCVLINGAAESEHCDKLPEDFPMNVEWQTVKLDLKNLALDLERQWNAVEEAVPRLNHEISDPDFRLSPLLLGSTATQKGFNFWNHFKNWAKPQNLTAVEAKMRTCLQTLNPLQRKAVETVIYGPNGGTSALVGKAGGGKTRTITLLMFLLMLMGFKILVVGQSNAAVDEVVAKVLDHLQKFGGDTKVAEDMVCRLGSKTDETAFSRENMRDNPNPSASQWSARNTSKVSKDYQRLMLWQKVKGFIQQNPEHELVKAYIMWRDHVLYGGQEPPWRESPRFPQSWELAQALVDRMVLMNCRLVCCTPAAATTFASTMIPDLLVVDEASQLVFTQLLTPVVPHIKTIKGVLVVGNPEQLPLVVNSDCDKANITSGIMGCSLMDRILANPTIARTTVSTTFRCSTPIVKLLNSIGYDIKVDPLSRADQDKRVAEILKVRLPKLGPGVVKFLDVPTQTQLEENGASRMNTGGIDRIQSLIKKIVHPSAPGFLKPAQVGIISMYSYDAQQIRRRLAKDGVPVDIRSVDALDVSTVDAFQGRERELIILHFVDDGRYNASFVGNTKRLNLAISRAQYGLLMVGNFGGLESQVKNFNLAHLRAGKALVQHLQRNKTTLVKSGNDI